jgi:hypothetical protein
VASAQHWKYSHCPQEWCPDPSPIERHVARSTWCAAWDLIWHTRSQWGNITLSIFIAQTTALPTLRRSTVWLSPAATWVYDIPSSVHRGFSHRPKTLSPATTQPSLLRSTF